MSDRLPSFKYSHEIPHDTQLQHWILFVHKQIQKRKDRGAQTRIDPRAWSTTGCFAWMKLCSSGNPILISLRNSRVICFKKKKKKPLSKPLTISSELGNVFLQQDSFLWFICREAGLPEKAFIPRLKEDLSSCQSAWLAFPDLQAVLYSYNSVQHLQWKGQL